MLILSTTDCTILLLIIVSCNLYDRCLETVAFSSQMAASMQPCFIATRVGALDEISCSEAISCQSTIGTVVLQGTCMSTGVHDCDAHSSVVSCLVVII